MKYHSKKFGDNLGHGRKFEQDLQLVDLHPEDLHTEEHLKKLQPFYQRNFLFLYNSNKRI